MASLRSAFSRIARRRLLLILITAATFLLAAVHLYFPASYTELYDSIRLWHAHINPADRPMSYGEYARPALDGVTLLGALPVDVVPTPDNGRRLIIVGDIHGMDDALGRLLAKVNFDPATDHLIATGDMISKGPDSSAVVDRLRSLGASAVRGNHEDRVLLAWAEHESKHGVAAELDSVWAEGRRGTARDLAVARSLSEKQRQWLRDLPVILTADPLPLYIVHAGLVPGIALRKQDPWAVMNMRTLMYPREHRHKGQTVLEGPDAKFSLSDDDDDEEGSSEDETVKEDEDPTLDDAESIDEEAQKRLAPVAVPVETRKGHKWAKAWNKYQRHLPRRQRKTVVYGHDAKQGYREGAYTFGLDSNCVRGGQLTGIVVEANKSKKGFKTHTKHVSCKSMWTSEEDDT